MATQEFSVDGLHCHGCADTVKEVVSALPGVESVEVALDTKGTSKVTVSASQELSTTQVQEALDKEGNFSVV